MRYDEVTDRLLGVPGRFTIWECESCGVWRVWPIPGNLSDYYPPEYGAVIGPLADIGAVRPWHHLAWKMSFDRRPIVRRLGRSALRRNQLASLLWQRIGDRGIAPMSFLDYGSGAGRALKLAGQLGMQAVGVDMSANSLEAATAQALDLRIGTYESLPLGNERFDIIHLSHVLEHLGDPLMALRNLAGHLADGGCLVVMVPNTDSGTARVFGRNWYALDAPRHLWDFTPANLTALIEKAGYVVESVTFDGTGGSIYNSMCRSPEPSTGRLVLPQPPDPAVLSALDTVATYWNDHSAGDSITVFGRIPS